MEGEEFDIDDDDEEDEEDDEDEDEEDDEDDEEDRKTRKKVWSAPIIVFIQLVPAMSMLTNGFEIGYIVYAAVKRTQGM